MIYPVTRGRSQEGHGRRSLEELAKSLPALRCEHSPTEYDQLCPGCGKRRREIGERCGN